MLKLIMRRAVFGIALVGGAMPPGADSRPLSQTQSSAEDWQGVWRGRYICAQGATALTVTVKPAGARGVTAVFSFHALPENPNVPSGRFTMAGQLGPVDGHLKLVPRAWTRQPLFYVMVGLDGDYNQVSGQYTGIVDGPGCTTFVLQRDLVS
jgi:hypothetical protein